MIRQSTGGKWREVHFGPFTHAFIVAQGPSLAKIDTAKLCGPGRVVIGMNNTYPTVRPDIWIGMDDTPCFEQRLFSEPFPKVMSCHWEKAKFHGAQLRDVPGVHFAELRKGGSMWRWFEDGFFSWHRDTFRVTIQFALSLGVKSITFAGVDLDNTQQHYADGSYLTEPKRVRNQNLHDAQFKALKQFVPEAKERGITVLSCSPSSRINQIMPFLPVDDIVRVIEEPLPSGRPKLHNSEKMAKPGRQLAILMNDCSAYHVGSKLVSQQLHRLADEAGIDLVEHEKGMRGKPGQLVIVNGEGTMHHNAPGALAIHNVAARYKSEGCRVVLINTVLQDIDIDLSVYDRIVTRESLSAEFARARYTGPVDVLPDLALCHRGAPESIRRSGLLFIDSVDARCAGAIDGLAAAMGGEVVRLCEWKKSADDLLALMATKSLVVTGRFHGAVLAMLAGTPFLAMPSNTWKTDGMLRDLGMGEHYHRSARSAAAAIRALSGATGRVDAESQWRKFFRSLATSASSIRAVPLAA